MGGSRRGGRRRPRYSGPAPRLNWETASEPLYAAFGAMCSLANDDGRKLVDAASDKTRPIEWAANLLAFAMRHLREEEVLAVWRECQPDPPEVIPHG